MPWLAPLLFVLFCPVAAAAAQSDAPETRAEAWRQAREEKAQSLETPQRDPLQRALDVVEERIVFLGRDGVFPKIGSLTTGSGFAFGGGYRNSRLFERNARVEAWAAGSFRKYWAAQARLIFPRLADGRLMAEAVADLREYPRESFFGVGPDSRRADHQRFALRMREVGALAGLRPIDGLTVGGGVSDFTPRTAEGSIDYLRARAFVEVDYRQPLNARRGGFYRLDFSHFADAAGGARSFHQTELDLRQYIGFLADRRVIALRGWVSTLEPAAGSAGIPFYLMPTLGGKDSLRGFRDYRFRGPHALLVQAEYRWELWSGLDAALFYDAGKVALRREDLNFRKLQDDFGFGFRFNTSQGVIMRVDAAFGSADGKHLHIVFGGVF